MDLVPTIKAVQDAVGVKADGIAGPLTWAAISRALNITVPGPPVVAGTVDPRSESNIDTLLPVVRPLARQLVIVSNEELAPKKIKVTSGYRTFAEQAKLYQAYKDGGPQAARPGYSNHNYALAFDVTLFDEDDKPIWESDLYKKVGKWGRALGLMWGGDWNNSDEPHFEYRPLWAENLTESQALEAYRERQDKGVALV